ncbi:MAG: arylesterase [Deltaproteobacteria bacterium]|nr:arylesterase [Candidatus Desulfobacula maris]MBL6995367.1 arylesterase [Desulfobacula sp.]
MFSLLPGRIPSIFAKDTGVKVVILGDSISAGLGVEPEQAFPFLVQDMLKQKGFDVVKIINGSISGSTTAGATSRLKWYLKSKPDILVLALGANDGLRGLSIDLMTQNLEKSIILAKKNGIKVILAGMKIPPNYGAEYAKAFESSFVSLAQKHDLPFIEFLLKDVAGKAFLNQADGIHPNPEGHKIIATTVFDILLEQL